MNVRPGVYTLLGEDRVELCHPVDQNDFETIHVQINGISRQQGWEPVRMRMVRKDQGHDLVRSDSPWLGSHALIFRRSVVERLGPLLREYGEVLPLRCQGAKLWIYNPTRVIDALDDAASTLHRFSDGRIIMIQRYVFWEAAVRDVDIFKLPSLRVSPTFVSHRFADQWIASGLKGLEFEPLWHPQADA